MNTRGWTHFRRRRAAWLAAGLALMQAGGDAAQAGAPDSSEVCSVTLRSSATVRSDRIAVSDVLNLTGAAGDLVAEIGGLPLLENLTAPGTATLTHGDLLARLDELGVNMSRLMVGGALKCDITLLATAEPPPLGAEAAPGSPGDLSSAPWRRAPGADSTLTLGDAVRAFIRDELAELSGQPEITFDRASDDLLRLSTPYTFGIRPEDRRKLGLRGFQITLRRDGRSERIVHLAARVRLTRPVVIARAPLNRGTYVKLDDLCVQPRLFEHDAPLGLLSAEQLVGQQVRNYVPTGQMVTAEDLQPVDMVQRSQRVRVLSRDAGVSLELHGLALDAGALGDAVRVRLGEGRADRRTVRGVVTGFGLVRLMEGGQ